MQIFMLFLAQAYGCQQLFWLPKPRGPLPPDTFDNIKYFGEVIVDRGFHRLWPCLIPWLVFETAMGYAWLHHLNGNPALLLIQQNPIGFFRPPQCAPPRPPSSTLPCPILLFAPFVWPVQSTSTPPPQSLLFLLSFYCAPCFMPFGNPVLSYLWKGIFLAIGRMYTCCTLCTIAAM